MPEADFVQEVSKADVLRIVERDFARDQSVVAGLLERYAAIDSKAARVHLAILKLSQGNLDKVREYVEVAKQDWRDVICAAEYPRYWAMGMHAASQIGSNEREQLQGEDFRDYQAWLAHA